MLYGGNKFFKDALGVSFSSMLATLIMGSRTGTRAHFRSTRLVFVTPPMLDGNQWQR